ncbi:MAG: Sensor protein [uncultured bacterium]|nr:MAG: Sensor protein [uncultured bacterium]
MTDSSLQGSQDILNSIILGIAHEINNPNTFVRVNATSLKKILTLLRPHLDSLAKDNPDLKIGPYPPQAAAIKMIQLTDAILDASVRLIGIAEKLKACTSFTLQEKTNVLLSEVVHNLIDQHQFLIERVGQIKLTCDEKDSYEIIGHSLQLDQAFSIILVNAIDAISTQFADPSLLEGRIEISLKKSTDQTIEISFTDNGCGLSPEIQGKIFTPYFSTKPQGQGDGIGLALAKAIIERHGGSIHVTSSQGQGCCFSIKLPCCKTEK